MADYTFQIGSVDPNRVAAGGFVQCIPTNFSLAPGDTQLFLLTGKIWSELTEKSYNFINATLDPETGEFLVPVPQNTDDGHYFIEAEFFTHGQSDNFYFFKSDTMLLEVANAHEPEIRLDSVQPGGVSVEQARVRQFRVTGSNIADYASDWRFRRIEGEGPAFLQVEELSADRYSATIKIITAQNLIQPGEYRLQVVDRASRETVRCPQLFYITSDLSYQ